MPKKAQEEELTIAQVAQLLELSIREVQALRQRGKFPNARQLPGGPTSPYLIPRSDLDALIEERKRRQTDPV